MTRRLSPAQITYLLAERRRGVPVKVVARALGVHPSTVEYQTHRAGMKPAHASRIEGISREALALALARRELAREVAAAKREWATSAPYKPSPDLLWP